MDTKPVMYRVQSLSKDNNPYLNKQCPVKRVVISNSGTINLNPDNKKFIYFSRTQKHHCYYIFNKILKMITAECKRLKQNPYFDKANLPTDVRIFTYYDHVNLHVIKQVQEIFTNYIPSKELELVNISYMQSFKNLFEQCAILNTKKTYGKNFPEVSDKSTYGGAYGMNTQWLELLKMCCISTETTNISIAKFLDFLVECAKDVNVKGQRLKEVMDRNDVLFMLLSMLNYVQHSNPDFYNKDAVNKMSGLLRLIENEKLYSSTIKFDKKFFAEQRRIFKDEYHSLR